MNLTVLKSIHVAVIAAVAVVVVVRNLVNDKLCYRDFVWFLISEEDKRHPRRSAAVFGCVRLTLHYLEKICAVPLTWKPVGFSPILALS